jgi:hypothetical protein
MLSLPHKVAFNAPRNLRISLQAKPKGLPLGVIQEKDVSAIKKTFMDALKHLNRRWRTQY